MKDDWIRFDGIWIRGLLFYAWWNIEENTERKLKGFRMEEFIENWIDYKKRCQDGDSRAKCVLVSDIPKLVELIDKENDYIGKTDINGKKIYADSSIVEFDFRGFGEHKSSRYHGVVVWNSDRCRYDIKTFSHEDEFVFDLGKCTDRIDNIKIIDTIQENKLGLIK